MKPTQWLFGLNLCNLWRTISRTLDLGQEQRSCVENKLTRTSLPKIPIRHHGTTLSYRKGKTTISNTAFSSSRPRFCESVATVARAAAATVHTWTAQTDRQIIPRYHCRDGLSAANPASMRRRPIVSPPELVSRDRCQESSHRPEMFFDPARSDYAANDCMLL